MLWFAIALMYQEQLHLLMNKQRCLSLNKPKIRGAPAPLAIHQGNAVWKTSPKYTRFDWRTFKEKPKLTTPGMREIGRLRRQSREASCPSYFMHVTQLRFDLNSVSILTGEAYTLSQLVSERFVLPITIPLKKRRLFWVIQQMSTEPSTHTVDEKVLYCFSSLDNVLWLQCRQRTFSGHRNCLTCL